jgi:sodium/proline symporter
MWIGVLIGTAIVIAYSFAGGIRADIYTDAAQSAAMFFSMAMILVVGYWQLGGVGELWSNLEQQEASLVDWFPDDLRFGLIPYLIGFACAGLGAVGQPHLATRIMSIKSEETIPRAGFYYFLWYIPFFLLSIGVGLFSRALLPNLTGMDVAQEMENPAELALPLVTMDLLPQVFVGIALGGLFAATVSTADSQIIVCSGALTQDVTRKWRESYVASKIGTMLVTTYAVVIALFAPEGVFGLVLIAWSAMGAALGPLVVLRVFHVDVSRWTAVLMIAAALTAVVAWYFAGLEEDVLEIFPGMLAAALVFGISRLVGRRPSGSASREHTA